MEVKPPEAAGLAAALAALVGAALAPVDAEGAALIEGAALAAGFVAVGAILLKGFDCVGAAPAPPLDTVVLAVLPQAASKAAATPPSAPPRNTRRDRCFRSITPIPPR